MERDIACMRISSKGYIHVVNVVYIDKDTIAVNVENLKDAFEKACERAAERGDKFEVTVNQMLFPEEIPKDKWLSMKREPDAVNIKRVFC